MDELIACKLGALIVGDPVEQKDPLARPRRKPSSRLMQRHPTGGEADEAALRHEVCLGEPDAPDPVHGG